jgi:hypothetical protein
MGLTNFYIICKTGPKASERLVSNPAWNSSGHCIPNVKFAQLQSLHKIGNTLNPQCTNYPKVSCTSKHAKSIGGVSFYSVKNSQF